MCDNLFCFVLFSQLFFVKGGRTALHFAAQCGFEEVVKILIEHGSNIDLQDQVLILFYFLIFIYLWLIVSCSR